MTKKKLRKLNRLTVAQLKQLVDRPDVVEMHDVTALDPKVLIILKVSSCTVESITNDFFYSLSLVLCPVIYCTVQTSPSHKHTFNSYRGTYVGSLIECFLMLLY